MPDEVVELLDSLREVLGAQQPVLLARTQQLLQAQASALADAEQIIRDIRQRDANRKCLCRGLR